MALYEVIMPIAGHVLVEVEAESEADAIDKAFEAEITTNEIEEWDVYRHLQQGNVSYVRYNRAEATMIDDGE